MEIASGYSIGTNTGKVNPYTVASAVNMVRFLMDSKRGFLLQWDITTRAILQLDISTTSASYIWKT
jgi:hypothetical protein